MDILRCLITKLSQYTVYKKKSWNISVYSTDTLQSS